MSDISKAWFRPNVRNPLRHPFVATEMSDYFVITSIFGSESIVLNDNYGLWFLAVIVTGCFTINFWCLPRPTRRGHPTLLWLFCFCGGGLICIQVSAWRSDIAKQSSSIELGGRRRWNLVAGSNLNTSMSADTLKYCQRRIISKNPSRIHETQLMFSHLLFLLQHFCSHSLWSSWCFWVICI